MDDSNEKEIDDKANIALIDHLLIRDKTTNKVLVSVRGTAQNTDPEDLDEPTRRT
jgi:hypothetical protein